MIGNLADKNDMKIFFLNLCDVLSENIDIILKV